MKKESKTKRKENRIFLKMTKTIGKIPHSILSITRMTTLTILINTHF